MDKAKWLRAADLLFYLGFAVPMCESFYHFFARKHSELWQFKALLFCSFSAVTMLLVFPRVTQLMDPDKRDRTLGRTACFLAALALSTVAWIALCKWSMPSTAVSLMTLALLWGSVDVAGYILIRRGS